MISGNDEVGDSDGVGVGVDEALVEFVAEVDDFDGVGVGGDDEATVELESEAGGLGVGGVELGAEVEADDDPDKPTL